MLKKIGKQLQIVLLLGLSGTLSAQGTLTLEQCRQMALDHNQQVKVAKEGLNAANSLRKAAFTQFLPDFGFTGSYMYMNKEYSLLSENLFLPVIPYTAVSADGTLDVSKLGVNDIVINPSTGQPVLDANGNPVFQHYTYLPKDEAKLDMRNVFLFDAGLTQPIFTGGKITNLYKSAGYNQKIAEQNLRMQNDEVVYKVEELYWKAVSLGEKVKLAETYKSLVDTLVRNLENYYSEGIIINNDLLRAKVKQDEAELMLMRARDGQSLCRMALCSAIGLPIDTLVSPVDSLAIEPEKPVMNVSGNYLTDRPELGMLRYSSNLAEAGVNISKSRFLPDVGLTANYMYGNPNPFNGFEKEFGGAWNVAVVCRIPIFHFGERFHTLHVAQSEKASADLKLQEAEEQITLQVRQARFNHDESLKKVWQNERLVKQTEENLRVVNDRFKEGILKSSDVLEAQSLWQKASSDYVEAKTECKLAGTWLQKVNGTLSETSTKK
ncbi:MAG TPA: TolC family protein [Bacteroidales bacterium]|nr:TolC family protein [Bacteroidales bacterium]HPS72925.1 TolC family protein [Bacteroidales bacterium]